MGFTIGSLFDGSGGFPLAASLCGGVPLWASEIEPYPIAVTRSRFPQMKHLGDISKINGAEIEPVDVITFGSPCQDLSVAGKRAGLKHETNGDDETTRSGLFIEAVRIIKEMRNATNGRYPTFALWENVPGAFSSNKGEDFRTVLEELIQIAEPEAPALPMPDKNGWPYADCYMGDGWSIAYRTFDAQYWGVPQRRRRIHLVADFRGECAAKILFERESLRGDTQTSGAQREETAGNVGNSATADDRARNSLTAYSFDSLSSNSMRSKNPFSGCRAVEIAKTIDTTYPDPSKNQGGIAVVCCIDGDKIGKAERAGDRHAVCYAMQAFGKYMESDTASSVKARDYKDATDLVVKGTYWDGTQVCGTLTANNAGGNQRMPDKDNFNCVVEKHNKPKIRYIVRRLTPTECARLQGFPDKWGHPDHKDDFSDEEYRFWQNVRNTHAEINGKAVKHYTKTQMVKWYNKLHTDSAEYKLWGNGIALPPALYCMQGISDEFRKEANRDERS